MLRKDFERRGPTFWLVMNAGAFGPSIIAYWLGVLR